MAKWPFGEPFYCGKTVVKPEHRLQGHKQAAQLYPDRETSKRLFECGEHLTTRVMEIVPAGDDWAAREKHWINILRFSFGGTNISDGGSGVPGYVPSAEAIAKSRAAKIGKPRSPETRAKLSAALKGRKLPPEVRAKMKGRKHSEETRAKMRERMTGNTISPEGRARISSSKIGRPRSDETRAKLSKAHKGKKHSPETIAKRSAALKGRKISAETRAKMSARMTGAKLSAEIRAKISAARKGRTFGPRGPYKKRSEESAVPLVGI